MSEVILKPEVVLPRIEKWILKTIDSASAKGCVVGLSGGIDSAVISCILKKICNDQMLAVMMPCHSIERDLEDARLLTEQFSLPNITVDLSKTYDAIISAAQENGSMLTSTALSNVKPRLRMTTLYMMAQSKNFLVCGTSNLAEIKLGYFTKYGDSGSDIIPLGDLLKCEVRALAEYLEIPEEIINKPPSAGLWEGQTDESEMGLTYDDIDSYLSGKIVKEESKEKINRMIQISEHKREMPQVCSLRN